jgi:hypothetical protein
MDRPPVIHKVKIAVCCPPEETLPMGYTGANTLSKKKWQIYLCLDVTHTQQDFESHRLPFINYFLSRFRDTIFVSDLGVSTRLQDLFDNSIHLRSQPDNMCNKSYAVTYQILHVPSKSKISILGHFRQRLLGLPSIWTKIHWSVRTPRYSRLNTHFLRNVL